MSTTARKARKRGGFKFTENPKFSTKLARLAAGATPVQDRAWFNAEHFAVKGTRFGMRRVSILKRARALADRGLIVNSKGQVVAA